VVVTFQDNEVFVHVYGEEKVVVTAITSRRALHLAQELLNAALLASRS
jgi:hypothetical protein